MAVFNRLPLLVILAGILALSMLVPAIHALQRDAHAEARAFFYWALLTGALIAGIAVATARTQSRHPARSNLLALLGTYALLPIMAALPMREVVTDTTMLNLYTEMVAALTTTGGSLYEPARLSDTLHLWRALVAWQGGLLIWIGAVAVLAPMRLGGFEVMWSPEAQRLPHASLLRREATSAERLARYTLALGPVYLALTAALWVMLRLSGAEATDAAIHAMSTMSTSGIVGAGEAPNLPGEVAIFVFLFFAVSRLTFATDLHRDQVADLLGDREIRLAIGLILLIPLGLFLRHWIAAYDVDAARNVTQAAQALWGAAFTVLSFLTTTGFEGMGWETARSWSGLETPAVLLVGLAMFGGGVATTAGGVKLLRVYALYAHGRREMGRLVHPNSVGHQLPRDVRLADRGIEAAWVFFMLFATSIAAVTLALAATGLDFRESVVLAAAALTTCGPLAAQALEGGTAAVSDPAKLILTAAMVVGRLEALALIALFNPDFWRR